MTTYKCPHCGREYSRQACRPFVPVHNVDWRHPATGEIRRSQCPGSKQNPRNALSDRRPLWKDDPDLVAENKAFLDEVFDRR